MKTKTRSSNDQKSDNESNVIIDGIRLLATICMYVIGAFFAFGGMCGVLLGDVILGVSLLIIGLVAIPYVRTFVADKTKTQRINGFVSVIICFILLCVFGAIVPASEYEPDTSTSVATPIITPNPTPKEIATPIPTPTPDIITISAVKMLPLGTELGDKSGWRSKIGDDNTYNVATRSYYKDDRSVTIRINVLSDNTNARTMYYEKYNKFGYDEYPTMGVGELSMLYTMSSSNTFHETSYGYFVNKNVFVEIDVHDYWIHDHEVCTYAKQVNRKIKV